jgi:hypothetical protein
MHYHVDYIQYFLRFNKLLLKIKCKAEQDLKVMKIYYWKKQARSRNEWKQIIGQGKTHMEL